MITIMSKNLNDLLAQVPSSRRRFGTGEFLFHRDDPVRVVHRVLEGVVHLVRHQANGAAIVFQRARPGAVLAEASLFSKRYHCDAVATEPTTTLALDKRRMRADLDRNADLAEAWAAYLAREVQATRLRAEILSLKTVTARLDAWLAAHDGPFPAKGEWKTVAAEIGTSPEAFYRELAKRRNRSARSPFSDP